MKRWDLYNASMEIASRCNQAFCKNFVYRVTDFTALWIDATPCYNPRQAPYNIHMVAERNSNIFEVNLDFDLLFDGENWEEGDLNHIAYKLGNNIVEKYAIKRNGILFFLDDSHIYPEYENRYDFIVNGESKSFNIDFPLAHYMNTEFDTEFLFYNELNLNYAVSSLKKNGKPIFDFDIFKDKPLWGIIKIEKNDDVFKVALQDNNFFSNPICLLKTMSYVGQYASLEKIPTEPAAQTQSHIEFYLSTDSYEIGFNVKVERIRNYGFSPSDLSASMPALCKALGIGNKDWTRFYNIT